MVSPSSINQDGSNLPVVAPEVIFVNQLDVSDNETHLIGLLHKKYPNASLIALHTHTVPALKKRTIKIGYDRYLSLFELGEKLTKVLRSIGVKPQI